MNINRYKGKMIRWKGVNLKVVSVQRWIDTHGTKYRVKVKPIGDTKESMLLTADSMFQIAEWRTAYIYHDTGVQVGGAI